MVDPAKKELVACFPADAGLDEACFKISYDILVVGVGSVNNTFGIEGVDKYCMYFKSVEDASALRRRVSECFERAALPLTPDEQRQKLLSFVIVGGGPTGVEVGLFRFFLFLLIVCIFVSFFLVFVDCVYFFCPCLPLKHPDANTPKTPPKNAAKKTQQKN